MEKQLTARGPHPTNRKEAWEAAEAAVVVSKQVVREIPPKLLKRLEEWEGVSFELLPNRRQVQTTDITGRVLVIAPLDMKAGRGNKVPPTAFFLPCPEGIETHLPALAAVRKFFKPNSLERLAIDKVLVGESLDDFPALSTAVRAHIDKNIVDCIA